MGRLRTLEDTDPHHLPRSGWGWVVLPFMLMMLGTGVVWGLFMEWYGDPSAAGKETFRIGPFIWSLLQLILLGLTHG